MVASNYTDREDGSKIDTFGPNPVGILMLDGDGRLSLQEMRSDLPKFGSNNRQEGTADENKAIVQGIICYFGTYTIDEAAKASLTTVRSCHGTSVVQLMLAPWPLSLTVLDGAIVVCKA